MLLKKKTVSSFYIRCPELFCVPLNPSSSVCRPVDVLDRPVRGRGTGRGRGARGPGYPRSNDGFDQRGKREFERHSGSDRT